MTKGCAKVRSPSNVFARLKTIPQRLTIWRHVTVFGLTDWAGVSSSYLLASSEYGKLWRTPYFSRAESSVASDLPLNTIDL